MYAKKVERVSTVECTENIVKKAEVFFEKNTDEILYVLKGRCVYGIITSIDYHKYRDSGKIINCDYKHLNYSVDKIESMLRQEAEQIFVQYKNIGELPVLDENGELCFVYKRVGEPSDVFPNRFDMLYSMDSGLARYIMNLGKDRVVINADSPDALKRYLSEHNIQTVVDVYRESDEATYCAEEVFEMYEMMEFARQVKEKSNSFCFVSFPSEEKLESLNVDERARVAKAKERTAQYYLYNFSHSQEVRDLAQRVLGENANQEFINDLKIVARFLIKDGLCYNVDYNSRYVNVVNGKRITTDVPNAAGQTIYLFGPCTMFGMLVEDRFTIASCLQRRVNCIGDKKIEVINEGMVGVPLLEEIRKFNRCTDYRENSIFVFLLRKEEERKLKEYVPELITHSLTDCFNEFVIHDYFFDHPMHCNNVASEKIADFLLGLIWEKLRSKMLNGNAHMEPIIKSCNTNFEKNLAEYISELKGHYREGENGAIVMNCNPFTNGHLYLIEQASQQVDNLYIFVVSEDKSYFPFEDRIGLVREGVKHLQEKVIVLPSGKFVLSVNTFPEYFDKENVSDDAFVDTSFDVEVFSKYIASALNIKKRFAGEEPFDMVTRQYNRDMKRVLPLYEIEFVEIPRKTEGEEVISASKVRKYLEVKDFERIKSFVPISTYQYLVKKYKKNNNNI